MKNPYTQPNRLADVLALIQVLSIGEHSHKSTEGISLELRNSPYSACSWEQVAKEHPEFFRVSPNSEYNISLHSRHITKTNIEGVRELPQGFVFKLMETAVDLHDRAIEAKRHWKYWVPIAIATVVNALVTLLANKS